MNGIERLIDCFSVFFAESQSERGRVVGYCLCFGVFQTFNNDMINREVFLVYVAYCGRFFEDKEEVGKIRVAYPESGDNNLISSFKA